MSNHTARSTRRRLAGRLAGLSTALALLGTAPSASSNVLFEENFDAQPDWTSGELQSNPRSSGDTGVGVLPDWFAVRPTPRWAPSTGHPDRNEAIEVLSSNSDKAFGQTGKSAVFWRESYDGGRDYFNDKILAYRVPGGTDELYVEFYIRFSPDWYVGREGSNASKIFRMYSWNENFDRMFRFGSNGQAGPVFFWNYVRNPTYGMRNFVALRGGAHGANYFMRTPQGFPRNLNNGDSALSYATDTEGQAEGGGTARLVDHINGGYLSDDSDGIVWHEQIFGDPALGLWTKMAFHVRMNSAPGRADGVLTQWINGQRTLHNTNVPWVGSGSSMVPWDVITIGGNDHVHTFPDSARYKEWYAIDEVRMLDSVPADVATVDPRSGQQGVQGGGGMCVAR